MLSTRPPGLPDRSPRPGALGDLDRQRAAIVAALAEYRDLAATSSAALDLYRVRVLSAMHALHDTVRERRFLEQEYDRIRRAVDAGGYDAPADLADDIRRTLDRSVADEPGAEADPVAAEPAPGPAAEDFPGDEAGRRRLLGEFKRVVLPRIHSDTAPDASFAEFDFAFTAYRGRDYLLLAALVAAHRDDVEDDAVAAGYLGEYRRVLALLRDRVRGLRAELTAEELADPDEVRRRIEQRHERVRRAIRDEAERVTALRRLIEGLGGDRR